MSSTVQIANISPSTTTESLEKFLGFCGKLTSIDLDSTSHTAKVQFEKESSARTAEFLNGGTLDGATLNITGPSKSDPDSAVSAAAAEKEKEAGEHGKEGEEIGQHDKPRSAIAAEYLAHGYVLGDHVIQQSIALDQKYGISNKFLSYWKTFGDQYSEKVAPRLDPHIQKAHSIIDPQIASAQSTLQPHLDRAQSTVSSATAGAQTGAAATTEEGGAAAPTATTTVPATGATSAAPTTKAEEAEGTTNVAGGGQPAAATGATGGVASKVAGAFVLGREYYKKALASPYGQKVHSFYTQGAQTVFDVHQEAARLANAKKTPNTTTSSSSSTTDDATTATHPVLTPESLASVAPTTATSNVA